MTRQALRSGTSVGACVRESEYAESKSDFVHKLSIARKECHEVLFWLELLMANDLLAEVEFMALTEQANELLRILISSIKTAKASL